jgi:hypothetical protein
MFWPPECATARTSRAPPRSFRRRSCFRSWSQRPHPDSRRCPPHRRTLRERPQACPLAPIISPKRRGRGPQQSRRLLERRPPCRLKCLRATKRRLQSSEKNIVCRRLNGRALTLPARPRAMRTPIRSRTKHGSKHNVAYARRNAVSPIVVMIRASSHATGCLLQILYDNFVHLHHCLNNCLRLFRIWVTQQFW